jgi:pentatricopeptide repeat protein
LKACSSIKATGRGKDIHAMAHSTGLLASHPSLGSALVDMYVKCGHLEKAIDVFQELDVRDVVTWTALIGGYVQHDRCEEALDHLTRMQTVGISPNAVTYVCGLKASAKLGSANIGEELHAEIERRGFVASNQFVGNALIDMYAKCGRLSDAHDVLNKLPIRDVVSWNALLAGYADQDHGDEAISCYWQMQNEKISPDMLTFASGLKACTSLVAMETGMELHAEIDRNGLLKEDVVLGSILVDMYAKFGLLQRAVRVFENLPVRDEITWSTLMAGFAQLGEIENVFRVCNKMMEEEGQMPNKVGFLSILCACSHGGLVDQGWQYFKAMWENYGITPILEHYACMIDLLARAGQLEHAMVMTKEAPFHPDKGIWLIVLGACRKWGNTDLGRQAFHELELLDDMYAASYVFMSNVYAC